MSKAAAVPENTPTVARQAGGRFAPGVSGNPGGRPRELRDVQQRAIGLMGPGLERLEKIIAKSTDEKAVVAAVACVAKVAGAMSITVHKHDHGSPLIGQRLRELSDDELVAKASEILQRHTGGKAAQA